MDELLRALVRLIDTGGNLADDALYLFFFLKFLGILQWTSVFTIVGLTIVKVVKLCLTTDDNTLKKEIYRAYNNGRQWTNGWQPSAEMLKWAGFKEGEK